MPELPKDYYEYVGKPASWTKRYDAIRDGNGEWVFKGWDSIKVKADGENVVKGSWEYVEDSKALVTFKFESKTKGKELPKLGMPELPKDYYEYVGKPASWTKRYDAIRDGNGEWVFKGWDSIKVKADGENVVKGSWEYIEDSKALVTFKFESATEGKELPKIGLPELPKDYYEYIGKTASWTTRYAEIKDGDGVWKFKGWNSATVEADKENVIVGSWEYVEIKPEQTKYTLKIKEVDKDGNVISRLKTVKDLTAEKVK